jgi:hypothetical protein
MINVLSSLRLRGDASRYKSFLLAIRTSWNSKKVAATQQRLGEMRSQVQFHIQVTMRENLISMEDNLLQATHKEGHRVLDAVLQVKQEVVRKQRIDERIATTRHEQIVRIMSAERERDATLLTFSGLIQVQLYHPSQNDRFDDIAVAHHETIQWALEVGDTTDPDHPSLYKWLEEGQGIYWISGKVGSGKSTLVKFLHKNGAPQDAFRLWAGGARLITVYFYFWNAGSRLQKSQEGMFRSILYQVLEQEPSLAQVLFPEHFRPREEWAESITFHEVRRAFDRLASFNDSSLKIAMMIDGLDEFDTTKLTLTELAEMFISITRSPNIKALLSSRPLAPFEYTFEKLPKLRLQELTHKDITLFVDDKLTTSPRIAELAQEDPDGVQSLISEIVTSASGVFLWVMLVVRSLLEGLQNYDKLSTLRVRLRMLPRDLEDLFKHMLRNIPDEYKVESSQIFQIVRCHRQHTGQSTLLVTTLGLADTDETRVFEDSIREKRVESKRRAAKQISGRLRSRCIGLLEVQKRGGNLFGNENYCVEYLHRSVADFLEKDGIWGEIAVHTNGTGFHASTALLRSTIARMRCM